MGFGGQTCLMWTFRHCGVLSVTLHLSSPEKSGSLSIEESGNLKTRRVPRLGRGIEMDAHMRTGGRMNKPRWVTGLMAAESHSVLLTVPGPSP